MRYINRGGKRSHTPKMATFAPPTWIDLGELTWTTGDTLNIDMADFIGDTSPEGFTVYSVDGGSPNDVTELDLTLSSSGALTGTIGDSLGGTYNFIFKAVNLKGTTLSSLTVSLVVLEITDPIFNDIPNQSYEEGEHVQLLIGTYVSSPGSVNDNAYPLVYSLDAASDLLPDELTQNEIVGVVSGVLADTSVGTHNLIFKVTNSAGLSDTDAMTMTVVSQTSDTPFVSAGWTGEQSCNLQVPTLNAIPDQAWTEGDVVSFLLSDYVASNGGANITSYAKTGSLPAGVTLNTTTGEVSGTVGDADAGSPYSLTYTATNSVGASDPTATQTITVVNVAAVAVTITGLYSIIDATTVTVTFSEAVSSPVLGLDVGFTLLINGAERAVTYVSGTGTANIVYSVPVTISGQNTLDLSYASATGDIVGDVSSNDVADLSNLLYYVQGSGDVLFSDNFDALPDMDIDGRTRWIGDTADPDAANNTPPRWDLIWTSNKNATNPPGEIKSGIGEGGTVGYRVWDESEGDNNSWGHDCQLAKHFYPNQYPELWIKCRMKFNPDQDVSGYNAMKVIRVGHYNPDNLDGTTGFNTFNTQNNNVTLAGYGDALSAEMFYMNKRASGLWRHKVQFRGSTSFKLNISGFDEAYDVTYKDLNNIVQTSWGSTFGDGQWHTLEMQVKMNSAVDARDGIGRFWWDGIYQGGSTDIPYLNGSVNPSQPGVNSNHPIIGFNMVTIGGNLDNVWDGQSTVEQVVVDYDSVVISVERQT